MSYCTSDFEESLKQVNLEAAPIEVLFAYGKAEEPGVCCHMDWSGGFVMRLENGRFAYLTGWCDYTGWGCQDGASVTHADSLDGLELPEERSDWDVKPADLNKWLSEGSKPWESR